MTKEQILPGVIECIIESLAIDSSQEVNSNTLIITDLGADSLDIMDIMFLLEEKFSIQLQKENFDFIAQVGLTKEEAIVEGKLTPIAKQKLTKWLDLKVEDDIEPKDLGSYISVNSIVTMIEYVTK